MNGQGPGQIPFSPGNLLQAFHDDFNGLGDNGPGQKDNDQDVEKNGQPTDDDNNGFPPVPGFYQVCLDEIDEFESAQYPGPAVLCKEQVLGDIRLHVLKGL